MWGNFRAPPVRKRPLESVGIGKPDSTVRHHGGVGPANLGGETAGFLHPRHGRGTRCDAPVVLNAALRERSLSCERPLPDGRGSESRLHSWSTWDGARGRMRLRLTEA